MDASLSVVKKLEHGDHIPTMQTVFIFCRALDIEPRDFIADVTHRLAFLESKWDSAPRKAKEQEEDAEIAWESEGPHDR